MFINKAKKKLSLLNKLCTTLDKAETAGISKEEVFRLKKQALGLRGTLNKISPETDWLKADSKAVKALLICHILC